MCSVNGDEIESLKEGNESCLIKERIQSATLTEGDYFVGKMLFWERNIPAKLNVMRLYML